MMPRYGTTVLIDDIWSTDDVDSEKPMSCGIFVQKKDDEPFEYTYGVSFLPLLSLSTEQWRLMNERILF